MTEERRRIPAWLLGLIIAVVLFALGIVVFQALGFGDDPAFETDAFDSMLTAIAWREARQALGISSHVGHHRICLPSPTALAGDGLCRSWGPGPGHALARSLPFTP